jgi:chromosome segregation ATPase
MSVQTETGYILLTDEINATERLIIPLQDDITDLQATIKNLRDVEIPAAQASLNSWMNAGNSDLANKQRKVNDWYNELQKRKNAKTDAEETLKPLNLELRRLKDLLSSLKAQRDAFEKNYRNAIIAGKSPQEAADEADAAARDAGAGRFNESTMKTLKIVGIVLLAGAAIFFAFKYFKK